MFKLLFVDISLLGSLLNGCLWHGPLLLVALFYFLIAKVCFTRYESTLCLMTSFSWKMVFCFGLWWSWRCFWSFWRWMSDLGFRFNRISQLRIKESRIENPILHTCARNLASGYGIRMNIWASLQHLQKHSCSLSTHFMPLRIGFQLFLFKLILSAQKRKRRALSKGATSARPF